MSNNLDYYINKNNWPNDLDEAKSFAHDAVSIWKYKEKAPEFMAKIDRAPSVAEVQKLVVYSFLSGEGNASIR